VDQITDSGVIEGDLWRFRTERALIGNPPDVSVTLPSDGATFSAGSDITINAHASDSDGTIVGVEFYAGSTLLGVDSESPYSLLWPNAQNGTYNLTAWAIDSDFNVTVSAKVTIFVNDLPQGFVYACDEGETCTYSGTVDIAYGANGQYYYLYDVSDCCIPCNNETFGDPIHGTAKACYVRPVGDAE
jgi:hypothetical protein